MSKSRWKTKVVSLTAMVIFLSLATLFKARGSGVEDQPAVTSAVAPVFPYTAIAANISGAVVVEVKVNVNGEVISAQIIEGHPLLRQVRSLEETARRWQFKPLSGREQTHIARLKFVFRIMPKETPADELTPVFTPPYQVEVKHRPFIPVVDSDPPSKIVPSQRQEKKKAK